MIKTWKGQLIYEHLEGGIWRLRTPEGTFTLRGIRIDPAWVDTTLIVEGSPDESFSFDMTGPAIKVTAFRRV